MIERKASRTAVLVCQGRAVADGRLAVGRFADPLAVELLHADERDPVALARAGERPEGFGPRMEFELLSGTAELMAARTVAIDDGVRDSAHPQLVLLGAGLDARAWRMPELAGTAVFEVDQPASQQDKRARLGERTPLATSLTFVPVDFAEDSLAARLAESGHDAGAPTTWIWEGVVPYLTPDQVAATVALVAAVSAPGSRFIISYPVPSPMNALGRKALGLLLRGARRPNPLADEPFRSSWTPPVLQSLLAAHGFEVTTDIDLLTIAQDLDITPRRPRFLRTGRIAIADRT